MANVGFFCFGGGGGGGEGAPSDSEKTLLEMAIAVAVATLNPKRFQLPLEVPGNLPKVSGRTGDY